MSSSDDRRPLTRARVVDGAIAYADEHGLAALSMRKLAASLGFEVMALYNHVANKNDLVTAITDRVAEHVDMPDYAADPIGALRANSLSLRAALEAHPWAAMNWVTTMPGPGRWTLMEWQLRACGAVPGLSDEQAHHLFHAVGNHVVGYVLQNVVMPFPVEDMHDIIRTIKRDLDPVEHAYALEHLAQHERGDHGESFGIVLDLILTTMGSSPNK